MKMMKKITLVFVLYCLVFVNLWSQDAKEDFYFDAIVFKSEKQNDNDDSNSENSSDNNSNSNDNSARIDIYAAIPNERLSFIKLDNTYRASFELTITISDVENNRIVTRRFARNVIANSFLESQGNNAEFSHIQEQVYIAPGNYRIRAVLRDVVAQREFEKSRMLTVINFSYFPFVASSIMLVSSIEENDGRYTISPHISDNIGNLLEGYFAFFEVYNSDDAKKVEVITEIMDSELNKTIYQNAISKNIANGTNQIYVRIPEGIAYGVKTNTIRVSFAEAKEAELLTSETPNNILAAAQRSIRCVSFLTNRIAADLPTAIRQMRYVASTKEINFINEAPNDAEKLRRFEAFWDAHDPTPHTKRNEAMEEYYHRIDLANKNFKSYSDGWLTDKGQVFIIFGSPQSTERNNRSRSDNRTFERRTYRNNRTFVFVDVSGFGDFRLYSPTMITDKYRYE
jgi:GWxTD domain-containing protein